MTERNAPVHNKEDNYYKIKTKSYKNYKKIINNNISKLRSRTK